MSLPSLTKNEKLILASVVVILILLSLGLGGYVWIKSNEYTATITTSPTKNQPVSIPTPVSFAEKTPAQQVIPTGSLGQTPSFTLEIGSYKLPLSSPVITDIAIRLEGAISAITPEAIAITYNDQEATIPLDKQTQFFLRDKDGNYKKIKIDQLQVDQTLQISLDRASDNKFKVNSVTIFE